MAKGSSAPAQTTTTSYQLPKQSQQILDLAMPGIKQFAASVPQRYPGTTVAGFTPAQTSGQQMALDAASGAQTDLAHSGAGANQFLLTDLWNPATNPNLQNAIDAAVRPITQNYQDVVRPALRDTFTGAGQVFGGSRRNIAEAQAARDYLTNVSDTGSKLVQNQYQTNIDAYLKALGLVPQTQQAQVTPAVTTSGVGDVQQNLEQQKLNELVSGFNYDQLAPFLQSQELVNLVGAIPGGTTTSTSTANTPGTNPFSQALGGAAAGASLGTAIFPGVGTGVGAGLGALLPFLG